MIGADEAAFIPQVSSRAIYRAIEAGEVHLIETPTLFICRVSLLARFDDSHELADGPKTAAEAID